MTTTTPPPPATEAPATLPAALQAPSKPLHWSKIIELGYDSEEAHDPSRSSYCFHCGTSSPAGVVNDSTGTNTNLYKVLLQCSKCKVASYCSKEHQIADWKQGGHKAACRTYARLLVGTTTTTPTRLRLGDQQAARDEIFGRLRFYLCPYAVYQHEQLGRGFLFVQSNRTLACLSLALPKDGYGRPTGMRSVYVHYLTLGEYDQEVCRDDFEMATVRSELMEAVNTYHEPDEVVVLMRFRCGQVALGVAPLSCDYAVCRQLGHSYFAGNKESSGALQLNLDDL